MNGRCKNDPLDTAEEVCGICGDEFCSDCLIMARIGKKKLVCKNCAVDHSGLRAGQKSKVASKYQVRKQKRSLKSSTPQGGNEAFTFFDDADSNFEYDLENAREAPVTQVSSDDASKPRSSKKKRKKRRGKSVPIEAKAAKPTKDESTSRRARLTGRRKNNLVETAMAGPVATTSNPAQDIPAPTSKDVATKPEAPVAQVETAATNPPPPPPAASEASAPAVHPEPAKTTVAASPMEPASPSAADLLSALKADEAAIPAVEVAAGDLNLETSPFSDPFADPVSTASGVVEPTAGEPMTGELPLNPVQAPASSGENAAQHKRRSPGAGTVSGQGRQSRSNISDPFAAGSASPFPGDSPTTIPQPEKIEPQEVEYEPVAFEPQTFEAESFQPDTFEPLTPEPAAFTSSLPLPTPPGTETFEPDTFQPDTFEADTFEPHHSQAAAPEPVLVSAIAEAESHAHSAPSSDSSEADTDSNGDWVPPLLRGMAPVSEREGLPLPQRRSED